MLHHLLSLLFFVDSTLYIETADRPGLLLEIIKIIADTNIDVESAEIDTEVCYIPSPFPSSWGHQSSYLILIQGLVAKDKFHVSYRGAKLNSSLSQVLLRLN